MNSLPTTHPLPSSAARNAGRRPVHLHTLHVSAWAWALAAVLALGTLPAVQAQTTFHTGAANMVSLIRGANFPVTDPVAYNAVEMDTSAGDLLYVDQDASLQSGGSFSIFTSMSWVAASRVPASLLGCDELTTPLEGRTLIVRNLALTNVDLNADNVKLGFQPPSGDSSLTLDNASLTGQFTPFLYAPAHFYLNASNTSAISNWSGRRSSVTTLNVASGGSLRFKDCGDVTSATLSDMFYLTELQNRAFINGGTLIVDNSAVVFGARDFDIGNASVMTFSNNATLRMEGSSYYTKLESDQFLFQDSTLILSNHPTRLNVRRTLELDNSSAFIADGAKVSALDVIVTNNSTVGLKGNLTQGLVTDFLEITGGATLSLLGLGVEDGELAVNSRVYFPRGTGAGVGTLHITDRTYLTMAGSSIMSLDAHAILTTTPLGFIALQEATIVLFNSGTFTNAGSFTVQAPSALGIVGNAAIAGAGSMTMEGWLDFTSVVATNKAKNSLTTGNQMYFGSTAQVHMNLDPTGLTSDRLICSNHHQFDLSSHPALSLGVVNDQPLPHGTKFVLIDYRDYIGEFIILDGKYSRFAGYTNHQTFTLGLNTYQINYADDTYVPGSQQFVTLTRVTVVAVDDTVRRFPTQPVKVGISELLANDTAPGGGTLVLTGVEPPAAPGGTVTLAPPWIFYQPAAGFQGEDSFRYTVTNSLGGSTIATVLVKLVDDPQQSLNLTGITQAPPGTFTIGFAGIPGLIYGIQFSPTLDEHGASTGWTNLGEATADALGRFSFSHTPIGPSGFYRSVYPVQP